MDSHARFFLLVALLLVALPLGSCGSEESAGEGKLQIAVIPKGTTHEFWKSIHAGAKTAAQELDVEITWKGPLREDDRELQIQVVETFIVKDIDAMVLAPLDDTALVPVCRDAKAAGIPVIVVDSGLEWDGQTSFVATDNYRGGVLAAEYMGSLLGGEGKVLVMRYVEGSASTTKRENGFLETIAKEFPKINILSSTQYSGATTEGAVSTSENLLTAYPNVDGVFCSNESGASGMLSALADRGLAGKVRFVGFDASERLNQALRDKMIDALIIQNPFAMGDLGVRAAVSALRGETVNPRIDTGVVVITPENMDSPEMKTLLAPDLSILDE